MVVGLMALGAIAVAALWLGARSSEVAEEIIAARDLKSTVVETWAAIQRAESSQRGYLYTSNEVYLAPYDQAKGEAARRVASLPAQLADYPELVEVAGALAGVIDEKLVEMDQTIALARDRQGAAALDLTLTNRGKGLMDEANVYITGLVLAADRRLSELVAQQTADSARQQVVTIFGAGMVVAAAVAAFSTIMGHARELSEARTELSSANLRLESKVAERTADLERSLGESRAAKDRAELLMREVNHRVANSLAMVSSLVGLQASASGEGAAGKVLAETQSRIHAVALVHQRLYASGDVRNVALDEYLKSVLDQFQSAIGDGRRISLRYRLAQIFLKTDASVNLGVIATEWVLNAAKYAYPDRQGEVRITLEALPDGRALLAVEDDGVGRGHQAAKGTGLGSRIVTSLANSLGGSIEYGDRNPGFSARLAFPVVPG